MQEAKLKYAKRTLTDWTKVTTDSLEKQTQSYKLTYMEKTDRYIDKVRIYSIGGLTAEDNQPRSLQFLNPEELLAFIKNCINSYFFLKEQRIKMDLMMPMPEYRANIMLPDLLKSIKENQLRRWREG